MQNRAFLSEMGPTPAIDQITLAFDVPRCRRLITLPNKHSFISLLSSNWCQDAAWSQMIYIFFLNWFFFLLSCIDCRLWYYFCMFKFVTQNYVIFNVFFFFNIFFCFLSRYCLSVIDLLCMQHIPLSRNVVVVDICMIFTSHLQTFCFISLKFVLIRKC